MNLTSTLVNQRSRARPLGPAPAAVAILYPKVGNVLRVPLRRTRFGSRVGCEQHPERQFIVWFNRMAAARPGFPMQIKSILLITGQPLCASCQRALATYLSRYYLADKLRVRTTGAAACGCSGACGCSHLSGGANPYSLQVQGLLLGDLLNEDPEPGYRDQAPRSAPPPAESWLARKRREAAEWLRKKRAERVLIESLRGSVPDRISPTDANPISRPPVVARAGAHKEGETGAIPSAPGSSQPKKIPYGKGISLRAVELRKRLAAANQWISPHRNVALVRVKNPSGAVSLLHAISLPPEPNLPGIHAEELLLRELRRKNVAPSQVLEFYSERVFCSGNKNCLAATSQQNFPNAQRFFSFTSDNEASTIIQNSIPFKSQLGNRL